MSKEKKVTRKDIMAFRGYKFYKEREDGSFEIFRFTGGVTECKDNPDDFILETIDQVADHVWINMGTITYSELKKDYTPIKPEGIISFNIVYMEDKQTKEALRDVMVLMYRNIDLAISLDDLPFAICRQSVNDFFSDFVSKDPTKNNLVGISCTRENCPTNIDYRWLMSCSGIQRSDLVSYYRDDTLEDILKCIKVEKYDKVLNSLYEEHIKHVDGDPIMLATSKVHNGWCRTLSLLLETNNAIADFNYMNNIIGVDFNLSDHFEKIDTSNSELDLGYSDNNIYQLDKAATLFLSETIKQNITSTRVIEFNYSIDMSEFNNSNYSLIRDKENKVYIVVYLQSGEFLEDELEAEINKLDVTSKLRLAYYNKYKNLQD